MENLPINKDQDANPSKISSQGEEPNRNINAAKDQGHSPLLLPSQNQSKKDLDKRRHSFSGSPKSLIDITPKDQKPKSQYHSDDPNTDKPSLAKEEKPEENNSSPQSPQSLEANPSSKIGPDSTPAADKEASQPPNLHKEQTERERDYETEIKEIKSKTAKTVLVLTASGLAIGGAAVACLILLPALPIYACGLLGVAIGAAIGLLILAIASGILGRDERKGLEAQRAQQSHLPDPTASNIDNNEQINAE